MNFYEVKDKREFKESNLSNWRLNSDFWFRGQMRHLRDIWKPTAELIRGLVDTHELSIPFNILDVGCGEGWLLRLLREEQIPASYVGLDFNNQFIRDLTARHEHDALVRFLLHDIEVPLPENLDGQFNLVVNIFNLFEVPDVALAFANMAKAVQVGGRLLVVSIDPVLQMLAVTKTRDELIEVLRLYELHQDSVGYDKDIDVGDFPSGRIYKSIFYSAPFYIRLAKSVGLLLNDYREVVKTANYVPQTYQFLIFEKR